MSNRLQNEGLDLSEISFVKRVTVGSTEKAMNENEVETQMAFLNRCLNEPPQGRIIGKQIATVLNRDAEHEILLQKITYHVGFKRKPYWLAEEEAASGA